MRFITFSILVYRDIKVWAIRAVLALLAIGWVLWFPWKVGRGAWLFVDRANQHYPVGLVAALFTTAILIAFNGATVYYLWKKWEEAGKRQKEKLK